ncbi:LOW QUALITY PROTEIN: E3 ubiquitin-protein ligase ATL23-like [Rhodamnia argentea]|uniref:RING-type E3 ubiquitin transferase n=1 Tax=Rhodamnia argentea TaxID=178133 RepID=A0ABM3H3S0_9MYRT|nr:LOW QUALITY PROTEIN: E3 ubiquitin-protein ligase ATL23-like [Rhodamnia argentea]
MGSSNMLQTVFLSLSLPFAGMSAVLVVYVCLLWYVSGGGRLAGTDKPYPEGGLSSQELAKLPRVTGKELGAGTECAVCLEEVDGEEPARLVPGCRHGFHQECADAWLGRHSVCPVCRAKPEARSWLEEAEDRQSPC